MRRFNLSITLGLFVLLLSMTSCVPVATIHPVSSVAVWDLEDLSPQEHGRPNLGELLTGKVIETIRDTPGLTVVERQRLRLALEELHLGSSSLADETNRLRIGNIVGADRMIFGGYLVVGSRVRVDLRLIDVESGATLKAVSRTTESANLENWFTAAESAAQDLF